MRLDAFFSELAEWTRGAGIDVQQLAYGDDPEQRADLRLPADAGPHPVAVVVHGGFWRAPFTRANTAAIATDLVRRGFATWNIEYRRLGAGGGLSETLRDVETAARHVASIDTGLDLGRVVAIGHSAGGHLALWLAGTGAVSAAVALAGVCDLTEAARLGLGGGAAVEFAGGRPYERPEAYELADPARRLPTGVRQLLVHGTADDRVPVEISRAYAARAAAAGDQCELLQLERVGHFAVIDPRSEAWQTIVTHVEELGSAP